MVVSLHVIEQKEKNRKKEKKKVEPCQFQRNIVCNMSRTQTITVLKDSTNFSSQGA